MKKSELKLILDELEEKINGSNASKIPLSEINDSLELIEEHKSKMEIYRYKLLKNRLKKLQKEKNNAHSNRNERLAIEFGIYFLVGTLLSLAVFGIFGWLGFDFSYVYIPILIIWALGLLIVLINIFL